MMARLLPHPVISCGLLVTWLILNQSLGLGHILLGALFGVLLGRLFDKLSPPPFRLRKPHLLLGLLGTVAWDIVRSNVAVAGIILGVRWRSIESGFIRVPLQLTDRYALGVLAVIVTSTPGTIWVRYDPEEGLLLIHVFDLVDEAMWVRIITERYQRPLLEVFE